MSVRVRFAPSPTGYVHVGNLRTALYDYMFAKKNNGKYILRVEDTDRSRLVEDATQRLMNVLNWTGLIHDEGVFSENNVTFQKGEYGSYIQSERLEVYRPYVDQLIESGHAYYCFCSKDRLDKVRADNKAKGIYSGYDRHCRDCSLEENKKRVEAGESFVVRMKMPDNRELVFEDLVRGTIKMNTDDSDDQVILKADGFPTYHMAVVVDDHLMRITHMVRGEEWLSSTPKQIILYEALGWEAPKFVHLSNILNIEKKKLSKRHESVAVEDFKKKGYLPEALINFLALIGWSPEGEEEIMTLEEMTEQFSFKRVSKSGGVFDVKKLNWMNNQYIKKTDEDRLTNLAMPFLIEKGYLEKSGIEGHFNWVKRIVSLVKEHLDYMAQITDFIPLFIGNTVDIVEEDAKEMIELDHVNEMLTVMINKFKEAEYFDGPSIKKIFKAVQKETGIKGKNLFMCSRVAVTGSVHGPDLMETISILDKDLVIERLEFVKNTYCK